MIAGCVQQFGEQSIEHRPQRVAAGGLPDRGVGVDDRPPVRLGAAGGQHRRGLIASGIHDVVIGSGVEHMGHNSFAAGAADQRGVRQPVDQKFLDRYDVRGQGIGAELIAEQWEIPRSELDELAVRSHRNAARATEEGWFAREIVPVKLNGHTVVADQGIRPDTSAGGAVGAQAGVQARRADHRRQLVADLRRRGRGAADVAREGRGARPAPRAPGSSTRRRWAATR